MAYPTTIDVFPTRVDNVDSVAATDINDKGVAIVSLETKIGVDGSSSSGTIDYFLKHASGAFRTHTHDGSSDDGAKIPLTSITNYPFKSGDWIISSVTTARTGWTNVSSTYSGKFIRIGTSPLTTGGSDTHNHSANTGLHFLSISEMPAHTHDLTLTDFCGNANTANSGWDADDASHGSTTRTVTSTGGGSGHLHPISSDNNVPVYVQVTIFQMN